MPTRVPPLVSRLPPSAYAAITAPSNHVNINGGKLGFSFKFENESQKFVTIFNDEELASEICFQL